jgi:hypothetical protein
MTRVLPGAGSLWSWRLSVNEKIQTNDRPGVFVSRKAIAHLRSEVITVDVWGPQRLIDPDEDAQLEIERVMLRLDCGDMEAVDYIIRAKEFGTGL